MGKTKAILQTALVSWGLALPAVGGGMLEEGLRPAAWIVLGISWCFFAVFVTWNRRLLASERGLGKGQRQAGTSSGD